MNDTFEKALHNFHPSSIELKKEDYQDRMILLLKAQGRTNKSIAEELGVTQCKVSYTVNQPWFMEKLLNYLHEKGDVAVEKWLKIVEKDAIQIAYQIMTESQNEKLRATAAFEFLKTTRGQKINVNHVERPKSLDELKKQEEQLRGELKDLEGRNRVGDMKFGDS